MILEFLLHMDSGTYCFYRLPAAGQQVIAVVVVILVVVTKLQKMLFETE